MTSKVDRFEADLSATVSASPEFPPAEERSAAEPDSTLYLKPGGGSKNAVWRTSWGRYQRRRLLGEGGMGQVAQAWDPTLERTVAVKTIQPHLVGGPAERRFIREARITGQLQHPGIVPVHDIGETSAGEPWFAMKEVQGITLADVLSGADRTWTRRKLLHAFVQTCQAVGYGHSRGVLHRDVKPANIMLGDFGEVLVLDWGVAFVEGQGSESEQLESVDTRLTQAGRVMGTPGYMPPEQARGELDRLGPPCDVWSLGAVLFEILVGRRAVEGATTAERLTRTLELDPVFPPPRARRAKSRPRSRRDLPRRAGARSGRSPLQRLGPCPADRGLARGNGPTGRGGARPRPSAGPTSAIRGRAGSPASPDDDGR